MHFIRHSRSSNVCLQPLRYPQLPFINPLLRFTLETAKQKPRSFDLKRSSLREHPDRGAYSIDF
jgi:hypothetical protein